MNEKLVIDFRINFNFHHFTGVLIDEELLTGLLSNMNIACELQINRSVATRLRGRSKTHSSSSSTKKHRKKIKEKKVLVHKNFGPRDTCDVIVCIFLVSAKFVEKSRGRHCHIVTIEQLCNSCTIIYHLFIFNKQKCDKRWKKAD